VRAPTGALCSRSWSNPVRVAALYDVHGQRVALEAVLADVEREKVDAIVFGGDLFLGPQPAETAELVRSVEAGFVRGNCDREPDEWTRSKLDDEMIAWSQAWPLTVELDGTLYCHASPKSDMRPILTDASPPERFEEALEGVDARLVVAGHTHMQFRRDRWANAGSVGWAAEDDVAAFWGLVSDDVEFRRTPFDVERAESEILASGWPEADSFVAENLRTPPSRAEATAWFESRA
jgi:predicted phosphodiesterase